jgi:hypothetical protein
MDPHHPDTVPMSRYRRGNTIYITTFLTLGIFFVLNNIDKLLNRPSEHTIINLMAIGTIVIWSFIIQRIVQFMKMWNRPEVTQTWCTPHKETCIRQMRNGTPIAVYRKGQYP